LIKQTADRLATKPSIPSSVVDLLHVVSDLTPAAIVRELDRGSLKLMIAAMDSMSLEIALQVVDELRLQHEDVGLYELAAALDLVAGRLTDAMVRR